MKAGQWLVVICLAFVELPNVDDSQVLVSCSTHPCTIYSTLTTVHSLSVTWYVPLTRRSSVLLDNVPRSRYTVETETRSTISNETSSKSFPPTHCRVATKPKNQPYQQTHSQMSFENSQISTTTSTSSRTPRWKCSALSSPVTQASKLHPKYCSSSSLSAPRTVHASRRERVRRQNSLRCHGILGRARTTHHRKEVTKARATT